MKKILLLSLSLVMGLCAFAQQVAVKSLPAPVKATLEKKALGTDVVKGTVNFDTRGSSKPVVLNNGYDYMEAEAIYTTYDLQSNSFVANRMYQTKDGSVAVVATMSNSLNDEAFLDRGTGYNFTEGGKAYGWNEVSLTRVEANATGYDMRTGWPSIAPYGAEGEILVNHSTGLNYWIREKAGEGVWDGPYAIPNPANVDDVVGGSGNALAWPRIVTTGENNEVLHIFAATSGNSGTVQYYLRTADLQNWDIQFAPVEMDNLHINIYAADDYAVSANGENIAVVYCAGFSSHVMCYESNDGGLTWNSRMVWESPIHGLDWETDEKSLFEQLYGPTHASVAIGKDGVTHVALGVGLYDRTELGNSYNLSYGLITDGVAYWNDTITRWEGVPSPIRSSQDDELKHALRLWWPTPENPDFIVIDATNFCAWMPPHVDDGYNEFESSKQYTGSAGTAGDYLTLFGLTAYPSIAVDPAGNLAVAYSSPDLNRALWNNAYYYRSIFVNYKPAEADWWQMSDYGKNLYDNFLHTFDEATFISAVSTPVNENEFWFSCLTDDTPGFHAYSNPSQADITTGVINVFKYTPTSELNDYEEGDGVDNSISITASVYPENSGFVDGVGNYIWGGTVSLTATPNEGYRFLNWTENGEVVSTNAYYSFTVTQERNFVANFEEIGAPEDPSEGDSTITNCKMRLASIASNDGIEIWDYIYSAPDNTHLVCINEMEFATPLEIVDSLEYDERGNITKIATWQKNEGVWIYACYVEYEYNDKNQKVVRTNYNNFGNGFELCGIYRYSYDEEGRMSEWTLEFAGVEEFNKGIIEYNEAGYKISETKQSYNSATYYLENANLTEYEYDANNNVTRIAVSAWDAGVWTLQSATVNEYDENGNCITSEQKTASGTVQKRKVYTYDTSISAENVYYFPNPEDDFPQLPAGRKNLLKSFEFYAQNADDMQLSYVTTYELSYEVIEGSENPDGDEPADPENPGGDEPNDPENPGGDEPEDPENPGGDEPNDPENPGDDEETTFTITAVANPEEGGTITGAGVYEENENVTLTATANECYQFVNWTEDGEEVSTNVKYSFKVTEDRELVANFELKTYDVVISVNPEDAGTVTGAGTYLGNQEVTLTATPISGYRFVNWLEDGVVLSTEAEYTFTVTKDRAIIANFVEIGSNLLTVTINPKEAGEVEGAGAYTENSTVTLKATAESSYKFVNWTENDVIVSTEKEYTFVLTSDRNLVANFAAIKYDVTVVVDPEEAGEVEGAGTYQKNTTVTLTAKANEGYKFVSWTEDDEVVSTDEEYSFVIKRDRELTANFVSTEGIEENASAFNIYPNPVSDKLYIETLTQTLTVEIYDVYGRQQSMVNGQQPTVIDVKNLNSGVYFVKVVTSEGETVKRFIKK